MATETPVSNKETKRRLARNHDQTTDHITGHVFQLGPDASENDAYIRVKRNGSIMGPETTDDEDLFLPMQKHPVSKEIAVPDHFEEVSPISDDSQVLLLSTPRTTVTPGSLSYELQEIPLALTTPSRKAARDRFVAGLQSGRLNGYGNTDNQKPSAPSESGSSVPSLPPTPTKTKAGDQVKDHRKTLQAIENRLTTDLSFDPDYATRDDVEIKPIEKLPEEYCGTIERLRHGRTLYEQLTELNRKVFKRRPLRPNFVVFPSGNVKDGNADDESRFVNERLKKGQIHVINCLNCELKGMSCPIRRPTPGFPMMNRYPHCLRCEREGKSHLCMTMRTATDEEKEAEDWQVKLVRTQRDDDERWRDKLKYLEELMARHTSKLDVQCFAPLNPALLPQSRRKWLDHQKLAGYGLRPAFDEPMRQLRKEDADSARLAPWMVEREQRVIEVDQSWAMV